MSKIAFIYPGQGAQVAGMGADFYENNELVSLKKPGTPCEYTIEEEDDNIM